MLLTMILMVCPTTELIGFDKLTNEDREQLVLIKRGCETKYEDSPCVIRVLKLGNLNYRVECGKVREIIK